MACVRNGPCELYADELALCCLVTGESGTSCQSGGGPLSQDIIDLSLQAASEILWTATGRQFGQCQVTIRPCRKSCGPCGEDEDWFDVRTFAYGFGGSFPWVPALENGIWTNIRTDCGCGDQCCHVCEIPLPYPVCSVDEVKVNGVVLDPSEYRVDDFRTLVRTPSEEGECWPDCQALELPDTEDNTFSVTVTYGRPVPALIQQAAALLACEFIKSCAGQPCLLPQRIQSISRQGITIGMLDPMDFLSQGRTGIYLVDMAINSYNPHKLLKTASVYSPDVGRRWRRVDT